MCGRISRRRTARRWGGLIGALLLFLLWDYGGTMIDTRSPEGNFPFGRGLFWTIDVERMPKICLDGHSTHKEQFEYVLANLENRSRIPEAVAVAIVGILSGAVPRGECEVTWYAFTPGSDS